MIYEEILWYYTCARVIRSKTGDEWVKRLTGRSNRSERQKCGFIYLRMPYMYTKICFYSRLVIIGSSIYSLGFYMHKVIQK